MTNELEIDVRREDEVSYTLRIPRPFSLEGQQLDLVMEISNKFWGDPSKNIGGPKLPPPTK